MAKGGYVCQLEIFDGKGCKEEFGTSACNSSNKVTPKKKVCAWKITEKRARDIMLKRKVDELKRKVEHA